jgi:hypothetical protein
MKISKNDLISYETEVDMPVWKDGKPITPKTICYDKDKKQFVLKVIETNEIEYSYDKLEDLVKLTNKLYDYDDEVVD